MPPRGSILIVVLGLLAVLAVVGIAFVTMSSIESNSAANFALQAQFDLAADGAVDYVTQALIRDVWEFGSDSAEAKTYRHYTGWLLTGKFGTWPWDWPDPITPATPVEAPKTPWPDAFLATSWSSTTKPATPAFSFRTSYALTMPQMYNLITWGGPYIGSATADGSPNNLGIPGGTGAAPYVATSVYWNSPYNGLWIPELAFPYENGIIRISVTVQDHAAMVNLNAHGTNNTWKPYGDTQGRGYFICDLMPDTTTLFPNINKLLLNTGTQPGRWSALSSTSTGGVPGNLRLGEIFIQNPALFQDRPFTLDDEFELRRLTGTYAQSRLEQISVAGSGTVLDSTPMTTTAQKVNARLGLTTVGWNAEVIPGQSTTGAAPKHKIDLNLAVDQGGTSNLGADDLYYGGVWNKTAYAKRLPQLLANILAFKERYKPTGATANYFKVSYRGPYGARRQAILSKVKVTRKKDSPAAGQDTLTVRVQLYNPWYGNYAGDETNNGAIDVTGHQIKIHTTDGQSVTYDINGTAGGNTRMIAFRNVWDTETSPAKPIPSKVVTPTTLVDKITLEATGPGIIDKLEAADLASSAATIIKRRPISVYDEPRAPGDTVQSCVVTVLYVRKWMDGADAWTGVEKLNSEIAQGQGIPIRFPHSVPTYGSTDAANQWDPLVNGPLPPYYSTASGDPRAAKGIFKGYLRVGDLNQVLCPTEADAASYWPWIYDVANQSQLIVGTGVPTNAEIDAESNVKWDWWPIRTSPTEVIRIDRTKPVFDSTSATPSLIQYRRYNAANLFCVDSPWADSFDNDGDGDSFKDDKDTGLATATDKSRFCGKEVRVAGRINLNTATDQALKALGVSLAGAAGYPGDAATYTYLTTVATAAGGRPLASPVEILRYKTTPSTDAECKGPLEKRDFWYTRISNIASIRSDTFSVYGTVQYVIPPDPVKFPTGSQNLSDMRIVRTRRFWALVDRSPALSYPPPTDPKLPGSFIRPRVLNFQWMD